MDELKLIPEDKLIAQLTYMLMFFGGDENLQIFSLTDIKYAIQTVLDASQKELINGHTKETNR